MNSDMFSNEASRPWLSPGVGLKRQIVAYDDRLMVVKVAFEAGVETDSHVHPHSQITYVESGLFHFVVEGEERTIGPGDAVRIPPGAKHACNCLEEGVLIDTFSPVRSDFLQI